MISGGLVRHHQSFGVSINNPFKDELRKIYKILNWARGRKQTSFSRRCNLFENEKYDIQTNNLLKIIKISFKVAGITLNIDGSKYLIFNGCNELLGYEQ